MSKTKQFTIAIDNQPGAVATIARTLGDAKVNILSLLGTAQGPAGSVQLIVEDSRRAKKALDAARIAYQETPAEQYELPNKAGSLAQCVSPFGVYDLNGNINEWVFRPKEKLPNRSGLKGGWWGPVRGRCRPTVGFHKEEDYGYEEGFRCCKDAAAAP